MADQEVFKTFDAAGLVPNIFGAACLFSRMILRRRKKSIFLSTSQLQNPFTYPLFDSLPGDTLQHRPA